MAGSPGDLAFARTAGDVRRTRDGGRIAVLLGFQNAYALGGDVDAIDGLARRGVRPLTSSSPQRASPSRSAVARARSKRWSARARRSRPTAATAPADLRRPGVLRRPRPPRHRAYRHRARGGLFTTCVSRSAGVDLAIDIPPWSKIA